MKDIVDVTPQPGYRLRLRFEDGVAGDVDVSELVSLTGVFAPLQDRAYFLQVRVDPKLNQSQGGIYMNPLMKHAVLTLRSV